VNLAARLVLFDHCDKILDRQARNHFARDSDAREWRVGVLTSRAVIETDDGYVLRHTAVRPPQPAQKSERYRISDDYGARKRKLP
jgi:hypothetical protein